MPSIPNNLSLETIANGAEIKAQPLRDNYSEIQTEFNKVVAILDGGTTGQVLSVQSPGNLHWRNETQGYLPTLIQADFTEKGVVNSTAETSLFNTLPSIPGGALGSIGTIHLVMWGRIRQGSSAGVEWTYRLKLGGTTLFAVTRAGGGATDDESRWSVHFIIRNTSASAQVVAILSGLQVGTTSGTTHARSPVQVAGSLPVTSTVDTTVTRDLDFTAQMNAAGSLNYVYRSGSLVRVDPLGI